ncbi:unnamed protein product [Bathycoccus prasinos]
MYNCSNFAFAANFAGRGEAGDNFFVFYNNGNLSRACAEELLKQRAETRFRSNMVPIWWQHIQRSGGYLMCSYARSNGVYDLATKICCPTCPCGHGNIDKYLDKKCHEHLDPALFTNHSKINNPVHSKKDRADIAHPTAKNVNFVMVEYNTFRKCAPVPGKFVYVTLLRDTVDQLISWAVRFEGIKVNKAWQKAIRSYENGIKTHGGYFSHRVHSITNTFGATKTDSDASRYNIAIRNLLKFNFVWLFENFNEEVGSTAEKYLNWKEGKSYIKNLGKGSGQYVQYKGKDSLPKGVVDILKIILLPNMILQSRKSRETEPIPVSKSPETVAKI